MGWCREGGRIRYEGWSKEGEGVKGLVLAGSFLLSLSLIIAFSGCEETGALLSLYCASWACVLPARVYGMGFIALSIINLEVCTQANVFEPWHCHFCLLNLRTLNMEIYTAGQLSAGPGLPANHQSWRASHYSSALGQSAAGASGYRAAGSPYRLGRE